jgi:4-azaleucine resistance transporter AzlC
VTEHKKALKAAFPHTVPVLTGFAFLGIAFGILMADKGYHAGWTLLFSLVAFAGSAQYMAIAFLTSGFDPLVAFGMALMVNARHVFYGVSMMKLYSTAGKLKPYLIFGMCDETFSLVCSVTPPKDIDHHLFAFYITLLNHVYWVTGSFIGGLLRSVVRIDTNGLDFVLTALFVVIFIGQWKGYHDHRPALIGVFCTVLCLILFGQSRFIIPSMALIIAALAWLRRIQGKTVHAAGGDAS